MAKEKPLQKKESQSQSVALPNNKRIKISVHNTRLHPNIAKTDIKNESLFTPEVLHKIMSYMKHLQADPQFKTGKIVRDRTQRTNPIPTDEPLFAKIRKQNEEQKEPKHASQTAKEEKTGNLSLPFSLLFQRNEQTQEVEGYVLYRGSRLKKDDEYILGKGAFGRVKLGFNIKTGEWIAIKIQRLDAKENLQAEIIRENQVLQHLGELSFALLTDKSAYSGMKLGYGVTLDKILFDELGNKKTPYEVLDPSITHSERIERLLNITHIALGAANEIQKIHQAGYYNRDIKSHNMLWDEERKQLKMIDQGAAISIVDAQQDRLITESNCAEFQALIRKYYIEDKELTAQEIDKLTITGTPGYLAPEIFLGLGASSQTEAFAFGVMLAEMVPSQDRMGEYELPLGIYSTYTSADHADTHLQDEILPEVFHPTPIIEKTPELKQFVQLAIACTRSDPGNRASIEDAQTQLIELKKELLTKLGYHRQLAFFETALQLKAEYQKLAALTPEEAHLSAQAFKNKKELLLIFAQTLEAASCQPTLHPQAIADIVDYLQKITVAQIAENHLGDKNNPLADITRLIAKICLTQHKKTTSHSLPTQTVNLPAEEQNLLATQRTSKSLTILYAQHKQDKKKLTETKENQTHRQSTKPLKS